MWDILQIMLDITSPDKPNGSLGSVTDRQSLHEQVLLLVAEVARLAKDGASARRVLDPILQYMDDHR